MASDTRTNAGVDNIATFKKMKVWERPGDRVIALLCAGNLAVTQSVVSQLDEQLHATAEEGETLFTATSMFQVARLVGRTVQDVKRLNGPAPPPNSESFTVSFLLGGQIAGGKLRLFQIYDAGNFIEATEDTPYFQIGEHKYGKPILDRVADTSIPLANAAKLIMLSFDSTLRSNLSVGMPIDLLIYRRDALKVELLRRIEHDDPYFSDLSRRWSEALKSAFANLPDYQW